MINLEQIYWIFLVSIFFQCFISSGNKISLTKTSIRINLMLTNFVGEPFNVGSEYFFALIISIRIHFCTSFRFSAAITAIVIGYSFQYTDTLKIKINFIYFISVLLTLQILYLFFLWIMILNYQLYRETPFKNFFSKC